MDLVCPVKGEGEEASALKMFIKGLSEISFSSPPPEVGSYSTALLFPPPTILAEEKRGVVKITSLENKKRTNSSNPISADLLNRKEVPF